jgi:hypothetical protein
VESFLNLSATAVLTVRLNFPSSETMATAINFTPGFREKPEFKYRAKYLSRAAVASSADERVLCCWIGLAGEA